MSDLNDDILNYELGDVDCEDGLVGDEDELLLSDDETPHHRISKQDEAQLLNEPTDWVEERIDANAEDAVVAVVAVEVEPPEIIEQVDNTVTNTVEISEQSEVLALNESESVESASVNVPVVENVNHVNEQMPTEVAISQTEMASPKPQRVRIEPPSPMSMPRGFRQIRGSPMSIHAKDEVLSLKMSEISSSMGDPESSSISDRIEEFGSDVNLDSSVDRIDEEATTTEDDKNWVETEEEHDDDREERLNPKTCVERGNNALMSQQQQQNHPQHQYPPHHQHFGRSPMDSHRGGGHFGPRGGGYPPRPQFQQSHHPQNDMYQQRPPYHPQGGGYHPQNGHPSQDYRPQHFTGPRPPHPFNNFNPHLRQPRPEMHPNQNPPFRPFNAIIVRQVGPPQQMGPHLRPRAPLPPPTQQPSPYIPNQGPPGQQQIYQAPHLQSRLPQSMHTPAQLVAPPRKILLNPNFKHGGTEAAKSQLLMDTFLNPQFNGPQQQQQQQNDAELLRLQEAFINQNRIHIEKRRYERSPDRGRDRDRDYTPPPPRRERRAHSREREWHDRGRERTGGDRRRGPNEHIEHGQAKRRRSESLERSEPKNNVEEDEETRVYRQEIEKQKAMREKLLREKEERRKRAADDKLTLLQAGKKVPADDGATTTPLVSAATPAAADGPPKKLVPIVVKEGKIISLKKKSAAADTTSGAVTVAAPVSGSQHQLHKHIPTAKIIPETKKEPATTAVVRPQMAKKLTPLRLDPEFDDIDEDALLADSPSPPSTPPMPPPQQLVLENMQKRRIVLKPTTDVKLKPDKDITITKTAGGTTGASTTSVPISSGRTKGIFDRLEKKISVNETSKRAIQRIVINNTD